MVHEDFLGEQTIEQSWLFDVIIEIRLIPLCIETKMTVHTSVMRARA